MNASVVTFQREGLMPAYEEGQDLFRQHYEEIAWRKDKIKLKPDFPRYQALEKSGALRVFTSRREGVLIGYAAWLVSVHLHYKDVRTAKNDVVFVAKSERGRTGMRLIQFSESSLKEEGVQALELHIKVWMDWSRLARSMDYEHTEHVLHKWIGD